MLHTIFARSVLFVFLVFFGFASYAEEPSTPPAEASDSVQSAEDSTAQKPLPLLELRKFAEVFGRIKASYVEEVDDTTLLTMAIRGMLSGLDPHSAYLEPTAYEELQVNTSGSFGGLGIEVGMENGFVVVITPLDDTPAEKAGIQAGDFVIEIDGQSLKGKTLEESVDLMRGEVGTSVTLTILRSGSDGPTQITIERDNIQVTSIKSHALDEYGYVRITQFQGQTGADFEKAVRSLGDIRGLIIDVRNNPGGVLTAAVDVAGLFLDEKLIVYTKGRDPEADVEYRSKPGEYRPELPIVVMINAGSASASEIIAGALQDHGRAAVLGTQSFGKGSVQNVLALDEDHGLKLTTALYYSPSGRSIQALGIEPDIVVNRARLSEKQEENAFKESDLAQHLENDLQKELSQDEKAALALKERLLEDDYQLQEALQVLQAVDIFNQRTAKLEAESPESE